MRPKLRYLYFFFLFCDAHFRFPRKVPSLFSRSDWYFDSLFFFPLYLGILSSLGKSTEVPFARTFSSGRSNASRSVVGRRAARRGNFDRSRILAKRARLAACGPPSGFSMLLVCMLIK